MGQVQVATYPVAHTARITATSRNAAGMPVSPVVAYAVGITPADHAAHAAERASAEIRTLAASGLAGAADAAWATADTLHAAAAALGNTILHQAADAYDRAARAPFGRVPAPTPAGDSLRRAARLLSTYGYLTSDPSFRPIVLITRLAVLGEAVAVLRETQDRAAQAASALSAAERLHAAERAYARLPAETGSACRPRPRWPVTGSRYRLARPRPTPIPLRRRHRGPRVPSASPRPGHQPRPH